MTIQPSLCSKTPAPSANPPCAAFDEGAPVVHQWGNWYPHFENEMGRRQIRKGVGALFVDDRAVRRQIAAGVALASEEIQHGHDVLAHENLTAGETDLES